MSVHRSILTRKTRVRALRQAPSHRTLAEVEMSGELGSIVEYFYFSDRLVNKISQDNGIDLQRRPFLLSAAFKIFQISRANPRETLFRSEIAERIRAAVGDLAVRDFVTPVEVSFATGAGRVDMGELRALGDRRDTAYMLTTVEASNGERVTVCLFGSMHNFLDRIRKVEPHEAGWTSSSGPYIMQLIASQGQSGGTFYEEDIEYLAVETVKALMYQGISTHEHLHEGLPETRGFTLGHALDVEWFAKIYRDVRVTRDRWTDDLEEIGSPHRILIGAPLWVSTVQPQKLTLYTPEVRTAGYRELEQRRQQYEAEEPVNKNREPGYMITNVSDPDD